MPESYAGYSSGSLRVSGEAEEDGLNMSGISLLSDEDQQHFFSYDPYFRSGQYVIETQEGKEYANDLRVTMGEQYMTLEDGDGRVWAVTQSRHSLSKYSYLFPKRAIHWSKSKFTSPFSRFRTRLKCRGRS